MVVRKADSLAAPKAGYLVDLWANYWAGPKVDQKAYWTADLRAGMWVGALVDW